MEPGTLNKSKTMLYILIPLLFAANAYPKDIEVANQKKLTAIHLTCDADDFEDLNCGLEATHYVVADGMCEVERKKWKAKFVKLSSKMWANTSSPNTNSSCSIVRREVLRQSAQGWAYVIEDALVSGSSKACKKLEKVEKYHEEETLTNVVCE